MTKAGERKWEASEVSAMLADRISALVSALGLDAPPAWETAGRLFPLNPTRADRKPGSMWVHMSGPDKGKWRDAATGDHGDALDLVAYVKFGWRGEKKSEPGRQAFKWALDWLGLRSTARTPEEREAEARAQAKMRDRAMQAARKREAEAERDAEKLKRAARGLWLSGQPAAAGGLCDLYLAGRGIDWAGTIAASGGGWPGCVRETWECKAPKGWLGPAGRTALPALLLAVNDDRGHIGTHRIYLDVKMEGGKPVSAKKALLDHVDPAKREKLGPNSKFLYGFHTGGSIRVWRGPTGKSLGEIAPVLARAQADAEAGGHEARLIDDPVGICEGFEDACAMAVALFGTDDECRLLAALSLGNLASVKLPAQIRTRYLIGDNDAHAENRAAFDRACEAHRRQGATVIKVKPPEGIKDVNDLILAEAS